MLPSSRFSESITNTLVSSSGGTELVAHSLERLLDGGLLVDGHEVGAHEAAGLGGVVPEQRAHLGALGRGQEHQHRLAARLIELGDEVGGVVGRHAREDLRHLLVGALLEKLDLVVVVELLEDVCLQLAIVVADGLDDLLPLAVRGGLHEVGDLSGMELGELRMGHAELDRGHVAHERLDAGPVEERPRLHPAADPLRQQPPQPAPRPGVHPHHAPPAL